MKEADSGTICGSPTVQMGYGLLPKRKVMVNLRQKALRQGEKQFKRIKYILEPQNTKSILSFLTSNRFSTPQDGRHLKVVDS